MMNSFINSFQSEWLKTKRSLALWLVLVGAFFTPSIILAVRLYNHSKLFDSYISDEFWLKLWNQSWESMAVLLLPMGIILATGLITQIEFKNNTWKQLHTTPQNLTTIFFAKLLVILILMVGVFALFNVAMYLSGIIPALVFSDVPYPPAPFPLMLFWRANFNFLIDVLPILALQYLISLQYKNFLVPVGVGFMIWVLGIGMLSWQYSFIFPYNHCIIDFLISSGQFGSRKMPPISVHMLAVIYFVVFTIAGYVLYLLKKEKG